jgi:hypothetical protein
MVGQLRTGRATMAPGAAQLQEADEDMLRPKTYSAPSTFSPRAPVRH